MSEQVDRTALVNAWAAAAAVKGPKLGDVSVPLPERARVFSARLRAFRDAASAYASPRAFGEK